MGKINKRVLLRVKSNQDTLLLYKLFFYLLPGPLQIYGKSLEKPEKIFDYIAGI